MTTKAFKDMQLNFLRERDSECRHDYRKHHFWEKLGVIKPTYLFLIWRCSQCSKVIYEPLEELQLDDWGKVVE